MLREEERTYPKNLLRTKIARASDFYSSSSSYQTLHTVCWLIEHRLYSDFFPFVLASQLFRALAFHFGQSVELTLRAKRKKNQSKEKEDEKLTPLAK